MAEEPKEGIDLDASYSKDDADSDDEEKDEESGEKSDSDSEDSEEGSTYSCFLFSIEYVPLERMLKYCLKSALQE